LALAREMAAASSHATRISFEHCNAAQLPFAEGSFDLAWCVQRFYSLPDAQAALDEMRRVLRPGGTT
jgi:ubiquinone/menaquinone biosynthesis C-methylase UbiE